MPTENFIMEYANPLTDPVGALRQSVALNNSWSAEQAQKQMDFQREMSDTAHQREVADLKAAGLNPVLSARLGGASTPSGAMAQGDTSGTTGLIDLLTLSMETANAAAGAARAAAGSTASTPSGASFFGLNPGDYKIKNAKKPAELAWNAFLDLYINSGVQIGDEQLAEVASMLGIEESSNDTAKSVSDVHGPKRVNLDFQGAKLSGIASNADAFKLNQLTPKQLGLYFKILVSQGPKAADAYHHSIVTTNRLTWLQEHGYEY